MLNGIDSLISLYNFSLQQKRIKYLGINLPKETKRLYTENYKTDEINQRQH